jgi:hypothetical protein
MVQVYLENKRICSVLAIKNVIRTSFYCNFMCLMTDKMYMEVNFPVTNSYPLPPPLTPLNCTKMYLRYILYIHSLKLINLLYYAYMTTRQITENMYSSSKSIVQNKCLRKLKGQSRMDNPKILAT